MNSRILVEKALGGLDELGARLESYGVTDKINRHSVLAYIMAEQKHLEGEYESLMAKVDRKKAGVQRARQFAGRAIRHPFRTAGETVRGLLA